MPELRREPVVGRWVAIQNDPGARPEDFEKEDLTPRKEATCPFCAGKEHLTPPEIQAVHPDPKHPAVWKVRVVPNKFPALKPEGAFEKIGVGMYDMTTGVGAHEVVIEAPEHTRQMADLSVEEIQAVLETYSSRIAKLSHDK